MKSIRLQITIIILSFLFANKLYSQLSIDSVNMTPVQMMNVLVGSGITFSNATFSGGSNSSGKFITGVTPTNLGITSGIILSTGSVLDAPGPNTSGSTSTSNGTGSDPQLAALVPGYTINDACYLQFDFVPQADTVRLCYVFGSEEYPEWVGSSFNDVFGFFITGINPDSGTYNNFNIATIPGTTLPVTINTINSSSFSQYYVDNTNGATIQYDGFTTVLTAWCNVVSGTQYSIKIAIGDAGDSAYDSAIFLEKGSLNCGPVNINLCVGEALNLTTLQGPPGCTYFWTGPNAFTSTQQNPVIPNVSMAMAGDYYIQTIVGPDTSNAVLTTVVVNQQPTSTFTVISPVYQDSISTITYLSLIHI